MALADIVNLTISQSAPSVSRQGFGVMLILGPTITTQASWSGFLLKYYTSASAMLTDGFTTSSPEYLFALSAFGQSNTPTQIAVGKRGTPVAQVSNIAIGTVANNTVYSVTVNGQTASITSSGSATGSSIQTALVTAINALTFPGSGVVAANGTGTAITVTSSKAGINLAIVASANLTVTVTTANVGVQADLAAIQAVDNTWYATALVSNDPDEIVECATWTEAQKKVAMCCSGDAGILAAATTTDVASRLKAASFMRTSLIYSGTSLTNGPGAAWLGLLLPLQPGSATFKFKTLAGITPDNLTPTQYAAAKAKNCNVYTTVGGLGMTEEGLSAGGEYIDVAIGLDWLYANMQADIFQNLMNAPKVPFTDVGAGVIETAIRSRLKLAENATILAPGSSTVTVPPVANVASSDRAARRFTGITFSARLAGAVHALVINGNVTT